MKGFPTLKYFENGVYQFDYGGERSESGIIEWIKSPSAPVPPPPEIPWSEAKNEVSHLTDATFDEFVKEHPHVLVMFYAPCTYFFFV